MDDDDLADLMARASRRATRPRSATCCATSRARSGRSSGAGSPGRCARSSTRWISSRRSGRASSPRTGPTSRRFDERPALPGSCGGGAEQGVRGAPPADADPEVRPRARGAAVRPPGRPRGPARGAGATTRRRARTPQARRPTRPAPRGPDPQEAQIVDLRRRGLTYEEIARADSASTRRGRAAIIDGDPPADGGAAMALMPHRRVARDGTIAAVGTSGRPAGLGRRPRRPRVVRRLLARSSHAARRLHRALGAGRGRRAAEDYLARLGPDRPSEAGRADLPRVSAWPRRRAWTPTPPTTSPGSPTQRRRARAALRRPRRARLVAAAALRPGPTAVEPCPRPGDEIGPYRLLRELGRGGFARVFLAEQADLDHRLVVVKVSTRITPEPRLLARARHPHIVEVLWHGRGRRRRAPAHLHAVPGRGDARRRPRRRRAAAGRGRRRAATCSRTSTASRPPEYPAADLAGPPREIARRAVVPEGGGLDRRPAGRGARPRLRPGRRSTATSSRRTSC